MYLALQCQPDSPAVEILYIDSSLTRTILEAQRFVDENADKRWDMNEDVNVFKVFPERSFKKDEENYKNVCCVRWDNYHQQTVVAGVGFPPIPKERDYIDFCVAEFMFEKTGRRDLFKEGLKFETSCAQLELVKIKYAALMNLPRAQLICYNVLWRLQAQLNETEKSTPQFLDWLPVELAREFNYKFPEEPKYLLTKENLLHYCRNLEAEHAHA